MGDCTESLSSRSLPSQTARRLGKIKPGPVFGKGYRQPGGKFQQEKQMPLTWLLSVENIEGMPERLVKWRFTLLWNVYSLSSLVLSADQMALWLKKNDILNSICCTYLFFPHSGYVFFFERSCSRFFVLQNSSDPVCVGVHAYICLGCSNMDHSSQGKFWPQNPTW